MTTWSVQTNWCWTNGDILPMRNWTTSRINEYKINSLDSMIVSLILYPLMTCEFASLSSLEVTQTDANLGFRRNQWIISEKKTISEQSIYGFLFYFIFRWQTIHARICCQPIFDWMDIRTWIPCVRWYRAPVKHTYSFRPLRYVKLFNLTCKYTSTNVITIVNVQSISIFNLSWLLFYQFNEFLNFFVFFRIKSLPITIISPLFTFQGDLHSYVRVRKRLRESEAKRLFRQMCAVVKSCHEQGIVLRDLKLRKFVFADTERWVNTIICFILI